MPVERHHYIFKEDMSPEMTDHTTKTSFDYDVIIIGAGGAGLMCAIEAGKRGRKILLLDHSAKIAEKIRISGGGRCNFTNIHASPKNYLSQNPHFCVSALRRYRPQDFIDLVDRHGIDWHEKKLGQLFCDGRAQQIISMLVQECEAAGVEIKLDTNVEEVEKLADGYRLETTKGCFSCASVVVATGGRSIPKMGASGFGYDLATRFGLDIIPPMPALVPFTFQQDLLEKFKNLAGVSAQAVVRCGKTSFPEAVLFTHRGLSGPAILQISSYWQAGDEIYVNLAPDSDMVALLKTAREKQPRQTVEIFLSQTFAKRLALFLCEEAGVKGRLADLSNKQINKLGQQINFWALKPSGTEGYRTAEVTRGGIDTRELSSKTFESKKSAGLYFIGEVLDVTGHLGGYNFQWAWASGHAAGQYV